MPLVDSDFVVYGSAVMPDDDSATNIGGAIDTTKRVVFTDIPATGTVGVYSSDANDNTQNVTITGRDSTGVIVSETLSLNGTTKVSGAQSFERILKILVSAAHNGTITVEDNQATPNKIVDIEPGVLEIRRPFYNAAADVSGGSVRKYYEKVFFKNNNTTTALTGAQISEQADPSGKVAFALESVLDGNDTNGVGNNRLVAPSGYTFDSNAKNVANSGNHNPGTAQGVWLELTLNPGDPSQNTTYTLRESGTFV